MALRHWHHPASAAAHARSAAPVACSLPGRASHICWRPMRFALTFAVAALVIGARPGWAQQIDPYADAVQSEKLAHYYDFRSYYLKQVEYLEWSAGCGVVSNQGVISALLNQIAAGSDVTIIDTHIDGLRQQAADRGQAKAKERNGCQYWRDHPEEVVSLRQRALSAIR